MRPRELYLQLLGLAFLEHIGNLERKILRGWVIVVGHVLFGCQRERGIAGNAQTDSWQTYTL